MIKKIKGTFLDTNKSRNFYNLNKNLKTEERERCKNYRRVQSISNKILFLELNSIVYTNLKNFFIESFLSLALFFKLDFSCIFTNLVFPSCSLNKTRSSKKKKKKIKLKK